MYTNPPAPLDVVMEEQFKYVDAYRVVLIVAGWVRSLPKVGGIMMRP